MLFCQPQRQRHDCLSHRHPCVDTTGAGDIFGGSAMSQMLKLDKAPEALSAEDMSAITRFACCAASLSTRHHGGINSIPEEQEVLELMRQG